MAVITVFLYASDRESVFRQLNTNTSYYAKVYSGEAEKNYDGIKYGLAKLAESGEPDSKTVNNEWESQAAFWISSFDGIDNIAWVDSNLVIKRIVPAENNSNLLNRNVRDVLTDTKLITLWFPVYDHNTLKGFLLGEIDVGKLIIPLLNPIKYDYMFQVYYYGAAAYTSGNWESPKAEVSVNTVVTLRDLEVFSFDIAPTEQFINTQLLKAYSILLSGLVFSVIVSVSTIFAQRYRRKSRLLESSQETLMKNQSYLELANQELEGISYSVSHDLKAPVRHIAGFISLLDKQYRSCLPEEGGHYLDNIAAAAKTMGELIDGLLQFSRTGRIEMHQTVLDMNSIVAELVQPIKEQETERKIEWDIPSLPQAYGDLRMIRSVWSNLLDNAVKYTKGKNPAIISIGTEEKEDEIIYHVKDNGVGFDLKYASKMFALFQRLHSREDFEGTGIGLAIVEKIITRQGGKTWAEGKIGEGATVYFSLIKQKEGKRK